MAYLELHLHGRLLDSAELSIRLLQTRKSLYLKERMSELKNRHAAVISLSDTRPLFILSGIPSSINAFMPLQHPKACSKG